MKSIQWRVSNSNKIRHKHRVFFDNTSEVKNRSIGLITSNVNIVKAIRKERKCFDTFSNFL